MPNNKDIALQIRLLDPQGHLLGGTADVTLEHLQGKEQVSHKDLDASRIIAMRGLRRAPKGHYKVLVTLSDPWQQKGQFVNIPPTGLATIDFVFDRQRATRIEVTEAETDPKELFVQGAVRFANGVAAPGVLVWAFDRDLRNEQALGEAITDRRGAYHITYSVERLSKHERGGADLVIKAFAADGNVLATSEILFNAPPRTAIDLVIPRGQGPALFERIAATLEPLLGDLKVQDLEENQKIQDLTFLAAETGFEYRLLWRFVTAHHLLDRALPDQFWFALLASSTFDGIAEGSIAEGLRRIPQALPGLDETAVRKALQTAFAQHEIDPKLEAKVPSWVKSFLALTARQALGDDGRPTFFKQALDEAGVRSGRQQVELARRFNKHRALSPELLAELAEEEVLDDSQLDDLRASYRLAEITQGDFTVVRSLKESFGIKRQEDIRNLAKHSPRDWMKLVERRHRDGKINLPLRIQQPEAGSIKVSEAALYGQTLERSFRHAYPTAAFSGGLERALGSGDKPRGIRRAEELLPFLERHPQFEILHTPVDAFLDNGVDPDLAELAKDEDFRLEVKAVQRVFKLAPTFEATETLLADGVHSAQGIYRMGESRFVDEYAERPGFTVERAQRTWLRAADTHAAVLTLVGDLQALDIGGLPAVLAPADGSLESFPNWQGLFSGGDLCACEHCRSVLGPAAYFADLLMFLRHRKAANPASSVRDILFSRRPDLGYLELNCDNAHTTLPYIDVVCEVLEAVVADGAGDVELAGFSAIPADPAAALTATRDALLDAGLEPGEELSLSQVDPGDADRWVLHGDLATYLLKKKGGANFFAQVLPNTKAKSDELRAYPAYVDAQAYGVLRQARFPSLLPFDLFAEEVRAGFRKTHLQRWDLMRTLHGPAAPNAASDIEVAAEYFSISSDPTAAFDEQRLILVPETSSAGQRVLWGETVQAGWLNRVANVKTFLRKTGLEYEDLLALLDLPFANPGGAISIDHLDSSCDLDRKTLRGLTARRLDRIHRFLRLWRKLEGWTLWQLDLVIRHPAIGKGSLNGPFLMALYDFCRLRQRLGKKAGVEQVAALLGDLSTTTHFVAAHEPRGDALYHKLFLNRRLTQPLDPAFEVAAVDVVGPTAEKISGHLEVVLAALRLRQRDLEIFAGLTKTSNGTPYISDDLTLDHLSFLWRHAWLSKQLKLGAEAWRDLLSLHPDDVGVFASPGSALDFIEHLDQVSADGLSPDGLRWILAADRQANAALPEADAARFLGGLRTALQTLQNEYDPARFDVLQTPTDVDRLTALLANLLAKLHRNEAEADLFVAILRDEVALEQPVAGLPAGFEFPPAIRSAIRIRYHQGTTTLRFTGLMTNAERTTLLSDASLAAVTGIAAYQEAIEQLFQRPRLALKFLDPVFEAPLASLPAAVVFSSLADPTLASRVSYRADDRMLRVIGILSPSDKAELDALSADADYRTAVDSLFDQPRNGVFPAQRLWLQDADLQFPLRDLDTPANDHLAANLAAAIHRALPHLSTTLSQDLVRLSVSDQLGLAESLTQTLLSDYALLPDTLLDHLTTTLPASGGVVDRASMPTTFDAWNWAQRSALLLQHWQLQAVEWRQLRDLKADARLLDVGDLPLGDGAAAASLARYSRTGLLLRLRRRLPETSVTLLQLLHTLRAGGYAAVSDFAAAVQQMHDGWKQADVETLVASLDLSYPQSYFLAESWQRLARAFSFLDALAASADTVKVFANAAMGQSEAASLRSLLRARFGSESWLTLSAEIQDVLRQRKRDALVAYLLSQPQPADAPSGKWENANDLYAYHLLDVEMSACQLTSRLVQASGSVQLFVQRCFMGLEPEVTVVADGAEGDSAWRWWKWMRKYRVWEANRKVFLWPENWIEPELRRDSSSFFKDLENELLQNEVNNDTVETAFSNYLQKLDGVAQLEIAGFYQEDDGDNAILHVFARTPGGEPHVYYYRRYDYRQWTPWEPVELDIQGDYLIPAVIGGRLFLFWPVFSEMPDEALNSTVSTPQANQAGVQIEKVWKKLRLQMAVSELRQGRWTARRLSTEYDESVSYDVELVRRHYTFRALDRELIDGRFVIKYWGYSTAGSDDSQYLATLSGAFEITGCQGVPQLSQAYGNFPHIIRPEQDSTGPYATFHKYRELAFRLDTPENDLTLENHFATQYEQLLKTPVLAQTPWRFDVTPPWSMSYFDRLLHNGLGSLAAISERYFHGTPIGAWLPFFYNDKKRSFFVLPSLFARRTGQEIQSSQSITVQAGARRYYPEIKAEVRQLELAIQGQIQTSIDGWDLDSLSAAERQAVEAFLYQQLGGDIAPPFSDDYLRHQMLRFFMRFAHLYLGFLSSFLFQLRQFHFKTFYHAFVCEFANLLNNPLQGIPGLMRREVQLQDSGFSFERSYQPTPWVVDPAHPEEYPREDVDFSPDGAYASYNWELFFHAPLMIANSLSQNQRFEEAREWYHYIFNPLGVESPVAGGSAMSKFWITKPFFETTGPQYTQQRIENLLALLSGDENAAGYSVEVKDALEKQVADWRTHPFEPHRIANYRTVAYQKTVVMKYLDNLIAWGDHLFRQDSMESINEATQLYILAAELLGPRPKKVPPQARPADESFNELESQLDAFSNALVQVENLVPAPSGGGGSPHASAPPLPFLYFCIPHNEKLLGYWDTVADRLYKIRHCMNIDGVVRQLALFEPPIDPGALVKAVAGGLDIGAALADLNAPLPFYRFNILLQKANEVCNDVKSLGSALLSALEKKDAEALSLLRQSHEIRYLEAAKGIREIQIEEAEANLEGLELAKQLITLRRDYYRDIEDRIPQERLHIDKMSEAHTLQEIAQGAKLAASVISLLPAIDLGASGFGGSPLAKFKIGGLELGQAASLAADVMQFLIAMATNDSTMAGTLATFERRWQEWKHQEALADKELEQIEPRIAAAKLRIDLAKKELDNHVLQIDNAKATDELMRSKYTNEELYQWQVGQISGVYFQCYQLAYDLAKRAERCFRFELGVKDSSYIQFGYWDSLKKGLLAGEKLQYDLRRLDSAYLEQNRREFELTKHVSLRLLDPLALVTLRETGRCFFSLPEELFDLDYPGHYFRRIKSVQLTLPCVAGPYTTISCTLRLLKNSIRTNTGNGDNGYPRNVDDEGLPLGDDRFVENNIPIKAIAASNGQSDGGLFELIFRDERYLPFEGAGALSEWSLELFNDLPSNNPDPANPDFGRPLRQFDYTSLSDAVLHISYTAREDVGVFKNLAINNLRQKLTQEEPTPSVLMLDLRRDFPTEWSRFLNPSDDAAGNVLDLDMSHRLFPFRDAGKTLKVHRVVLLARCTDGGVYDVTLGPPVPQPPPAGANGVALTRSTQHGGLHFGQKDVLAAGIEIVPHAEPVTWSLRMTRPGGGDLGKDPASGEMEVQDLILVLGYQWD